MQTFEAVEKKLIFYTSVGHPFDPWYLREADRVLLRLAAERYPDIEIELQDAQHPIPHLRDLDYVRVVMPKETECPTRSPTSTELSNPLENTSKQQKSFGRMAVEIVLRRMLKFDVASSTRSTI
jgi:hypothetical protein